MVADSLLHRFDQRRLGLDQQLDFDTDAQWGDRLFRLEDRRAELQARMTSRRTESYVPTSFSQALFRVT